MNPAPVIVVIPHSLGKAEAARRIKTQIDDARTRYAAKFKVAEETWDGDRLNFRVALLGQPVTGNIAVNDDNVRIEAKLSWYLGHLAKPAATLLQKEGMKVFAEA